MKTPGMIYLSIAIVIGLIAFFGWKATARAAYESAKYTVIETDGPCEIREYPDLLLATTSMRFAAQGEDGSFMRLFRYISGANDAEQKVAMTTPVFMEPETGESTGRMGFVIPQKVAQQGAPGPTGDKVELTKRAGGRFAVIRFSGRMTTARFQDAEKRLREWMAARNLAADGAAETAGYDPPWTPGPLRRNEVLIRLKKEATLAP